MLLAWIAFSVIISFMALVVAATCGLDGDTTTAAIALLVMFFSWTWPVVIPPLVILLIIGAVFFILEELWGIDRPRWWQKFLEVIHLEDA